MVFICRNRQTAPAPNLANGSLSQSQTDCLIEEEGNCPDHTKQGVDGKCDEPDQEFSARTKSPLVCNTLIEHHS